MGPNFPQNGVSGPTAMHRHRCWCTEQPAPATMFRGRPRHAPQRGAPPTAQCCSSASVLRPLASRCRRAASSCCMRLMAASSATFGDTACAYRSSNRSCKRGQPGGRRRHQQRGRQGGSGWQAAQDCGANARRGTPLGRGWQAACQPAAAASEDRCASHDRAPASLDAAAARRPARQAAQLWARTPPPTHTATTPTRTPAGCWP